MALLDAFRVTRIVLMVSALALVTPCGAHVELGPARAKQPPRWEDVSLMAVAHDSPAVNDLTFLSTGRGWLLTHSQLLESNDSGGDWTVRYAGDGRRFFSALLFSDAKLGWIVGSKLDGEGGKPLILHTTDGGRGWSEQPVSFGHAPATTRPGGFHGLSLCGSTLWAITDNYVARTTDDGRTWEAQRLTADGESLTAIACASPERVIAVGAGGIILQSRDGGLTWTRQASGVTTLLARARHFEGKFWVVGEDGLILRADVDSLKFERLPKATTQPLYDIYMSDGRGWAVGENGTILYTTDGGAVWQKQESLTQSALTRLYFISSGQGWAGGSELTLLRLSN